MCKFKLLNLFSTDNTKIRMMKITDLKTNPKFKGLYNQEPEKVEEIYKSILENGFDRTQPIIILSDGTVIDGHSRLLGAIKAGCAKVPVIVKEGIESETDVLIYEEHLQLSRRNLSQAEKMIHLENFLKLKEQAQNEGKDLKEFSDESLSKKLDVSPRQLQKMREVESKATPAQLESIRSGEASLNKVHEEIKKIQGLSRKSPVLKNVTEKDISVEKNEAREKETTNNYVAAILSLIEKSIPVTEVSTDFKKELEKLFKLKEVKHETE